jgi:pantoate--beta-alanine ligase
VIVASTIEKVRELLWQDPNLSWGLVPTMGYLHAGHLSLVRRARKDNDMVAVSIFVNPTQFAASEDLSSYPRDLQRDLSLLERQRADLVFIPDEETIYPKGFQSSVIVSQVSMPLEGGSRPNHFKGVTTVVAKLLNIFQPTRAYFGQKDAQQAVVIRQLVRDLNFNLDLVVCPIIREADGLAMSSRNVRLSEKQRSAAPTLFKALGKAIEAIQGNERNADRLRQIMRETISTEELARLDYVSVADPETLLELEIVEDQALLSLAVYFGSVRLIDNVLWREKLA